MKKVLRRTKRESRMIPDWKCEVGHIMAILILCFITIILFGLALYKAEKRYNALQTSIAAIHR